MALNHETGVLSGTPRAVGTFPIALKATNSVGSATQAFTLRVVTVKIETTTLFPSTRTKSYSMTLAAVGGKPPYTWSILRGPQPSGLTLSPNGEVTGTPKIVDTAKTYVVTFKVKDATRPSCNAATAMLGLVVN